MSQKKLDIQTLVLAYSNGYFPMPDPSTEEILWFNPDPRCIIPLNGFHCSRSLKRRINKGGYEVTINKAFKEVMDGCAQRKETWINDEFKRAYLHLHHIGIGASLEIWREGALIGGIYGVSLGGAFFAESKFHRETDASKLALYHLVERLNDNKFILLEVQFLIPHLKSLGAIEIPGDTYKDQLKEALQMNCKLR